MVEKIMNFIRNKKYEGKLNRYIIITTAVVVVVIILLFIVMYLNKTYSYYDVEDKLNSAAKNYFKDNESLLPIDNNPATVTAEDLESGKYVKPLFKLIKDDVCTAYVEVYKIDNDYEYISYLNCGEKYSTELIDSVVLNNNPVVETGTGLYQVNEDYIFRGEKPNNYIEISDKLWRIIKVDRNGFMKLILDDILKNENDREIARVEWDDRYNANEKSTYGINTYSVSRIKETLNNKFDEIIFENHKDKLVKFETCVGKRMEDYNINTGEAECGQLDKKEYISLLPLHEYIYSSLDSTCSASTDIQCQNYNYLAKFSTYWWTITGVFENTYQVYMIDQKGEILKLRAIDTAQLRPVIMLNNRLLYAEGDGSLNNPYKLR